MSNVKWSKAQKADRQPFRVTVSDFLRGKDLLEKEWNAGQSHEPDDTLTGTRESSGSWLNLAPGTQV